jgi:hypothetical protein
MSQIFFVAVRCIVWLGQSLCVSLEDSLSVRVNIIQPRNGQDRFTRIKSGDTPVDAPSSHSPACPHGDWFQATSGLRAHNNRKVTRL